MRIIFVARTWPSLTTSQITLRYYIPHSTLLNKLCNNKDYIFALLHEMGNIIKK